MALAAGGERAAGVPRDSAAACGAHRGRIGRSVAVQPSTPADELLGLIPSEDSSGERRRQGSITKAGNGSARRALVEAAWAYQYMAKVSGLIARRQVKAPKAALDIAWKAQVRLCARFRRLAPHVSVRSRNKIVVAIARELAGFVWAIGQQVKRV